VLSLDKGIGAKTGYTAKRTLEARMEFNMRASGNVKRADIL
jgi:hypothetical protein